jgi:glycosyltransferase family protein
MDSAGTVEYIKKNNCSIARFGDGEVDIMNGFSLGFQKHSKKLVKKLHAVANDKGLLVCLPNWFNPELNEKTYTDFELDVINNDMKKRRYFWYKNFKNKLYGDTNLSRFYLGRRDKSNCWEYVGKMKQIWQDREIVFIEGERSRLGVGNDLFNNAKSTQRILCPAENAFDKVDEIHDYIAKNIDQKKLLVLALGPTATCLASDLNRDGFQALDVGHLDIEYEWLKMRATEKVIIPNKHVNEVKVDGKGYKGTMSVTDKKYYDEIIKTFA